MDENLGTYDVKYWPPAINEINGGLGYYPGHWYSQEDFIREYSASNFEEAMENRRALGREFGVVVPIFGVPTRIETQPAVEATKGVLTAIADMPGREGVKLLVLWLGGDSYHVFAVNLSEQTRTQAGDYMYLNPDVVPAPEGYIVRLAREGRLDEEGYNNQKLFALLNHEIK